MRVEQGNIHGLLRLIPEPIQDERGFFARTWTAEMAERLGLPWAPDHEALAFNPQKYTLRGMHYQKAPWAEAKRVRCLRGAIWDVAVDLRAESPTFLKWEAFELNEDNLECLFLPAGLAHGYLSLREESLVEYGLYMPYRAEASSGFRWDDPQLAIRWPHPPVVIGKRDRELPFWGQ